MFLHLTSQIIEALRPYVSEKVVVDLGAGDMRLTALCARKLGAARVLAVDKEFGGVPRGRGVVPHPWLPRTTVLRSYFADVRADICVADLALVSWPANHAMPGLVHLLSCAKVVAYIGRNDAEDGTACGPRDLFEHMLSRDLLAVVEHADNDLVIVGALIPAGARRAPSKPEADGFAAWGAT